MDVYGHLFPGAFSRLVDALDEVTERDPRVTKPELTVRISRSDR
jgi:hypothetical protein